MNLLRRIPWVPITRLILMLGMGIPGVALLVDPGAWSHVTGALGAVQNVIPITVFGLILLVGVVLVMSLKTREFGYLIGCLSYAILAVGFLSTVLAGTVLSPFGVGYFLISCFYALAVTDAVQARIQGEGPDG